MSPDNLGVGKDLETQEREKISPKNPAAGDSRGYGLPGRGSDMGSAKNTESQIFNILGCSLF